MLEGSLHLPAALRLLAHFWLEEVQPSDLETLATLPGLGEALLATGGAEEGHLFIELAVEYQRLFGFNLPPYESLFIDPSAMLNAPAAQQVQALYMQAGWSQPHGPRAGAPDHLGFELLALADWLDWPAAIGDASGRAAARPGPLVSLANRLLCAHLALWAPAFLLALQHLSPHPFYAVLGELTLGLLLEMLPAGTLQAGKDPFPALPPAPIYRATLEIPEPGETEIDPEPRWQETSLSSILYRLLTPREAGLYLTRQDLASIGITLDLPGMAGERANNLRTLFSLAGQYDLLPGLFAQFERIFAQAGGDYAGLAELYPDWKPYATAWQQRLDGTRQYLQALQEIEPA